jgi:hypothetical protein
VVAGVGILLITVLAGLANFGAIESLVTGGDATKTAHDILASESSFRLAIGAFVLVAVLDAVVAWGLYAFFKPVSRMCRCSRDGCGWHMPRSSRSRSANSPAHFTCSATPCGCPKLGPRPLTCCFTAGDSPA